MFTTTRQAEPKDMLLKRYQQFQRRMARHYLNLTESTQDKLADTLSQPSSNRVTLGVINNSQMTSFPPSQPLHNSQNEQRGLSVPNATRGTTRMLTAAPPTSKIASKPKNNFAFSVYSDAGSFDTIGGGGGGAGTTSVESSSLQETSHWRILASEADRRKENEG